MKFKEYAGRAKKQSNQAKDACDNTTAWLLSTLQHALYCSRALVPYDCAELLQNLCLRSRSAENKSANADHQDYQRCQRKHTVKGERRPHAWRVVATPLAECLFEE